MKGEDSAVHSRGRRLARKNASCMQHGKLSLANYYFLPWQLQREWRLPSLLTFAMRHFRKFSRGALCALFLLATSLNALAQEENWQVSTPGEFHDGEAPIKPGSGWFALVPASGQWRLETSIVRAKRVVDEIAGDNSGIKITSSQPNTLVLLKFPGLKAGRVATPNMKFIDNPRLLELQNPAIEIEFAGEKHFVGIQKSGVYLKKGKQKQILHDAKEVKDPDFTASILWAGDVDGDGKLDFFFETTTLNSNSKCMYLSSVADTGTLVKQIGCQTSSGC